MAWYAVYDTTDGSLFSVGQVTASDDELSSRGLAKKEIPNPPGNRDVWNTTTLVFDNVPLTPEEIEQQNERPNAETRLKAMYDGLSQWAADADNAVAAWDGWTATQRQAATKVLMQRFGRLCEGLKDLLLWSYLNG